MKHNIATPCLSIMLCILSVKLSHADFIGMNEYGIHTGKLADTSRSQGPLKLTVKLLPIGTHKSNFSVEVSVKNVGKEKVERFTKGDARDFEFTVTDQHGNNALLTEHGRQLLLPPAEARDFTERGVTSTPMNVSFALKPGMEDTTVVPLSDLFDLSQLGVYSIHVTMAGNNEDHFLPKSHTQKSATKEPTSVIIRSNTLKIKHDVIGFSLDASEVSMTKPNHV